MNYKNSLLVVLLLLTGCVTDIAASFVCLTGVCSSDEERLAEIQWVPATLDKTTCQSIDGEYKDDTWRNNKPGDSLIRQLDFRLHRDDTKSSQLGMQEDFEDYQRTPDEPNFYKNTVTTIKQQGNLLEVTLTDAIGKRYKKSIVNLAHPQIGCIDGILTIRIMSIGSGGVDGAYGLASAREKKYTKLLDGSLQVSISGREWYYTYARGLIGYDANNHASGTEPRKSQYTLIFPPAKSMR